MRFLDIEGHRLGVIAVGEDRPGPPLILLHGVAFSFQFWPPNLPASIRDSYRWYSLTQPFHAPATLPDIPPEAVSAEMFGRLLSRAVQTLVGDEPAILIGHSLGGFAALNLAAREPQRVRAVVSISGIASGRGLGIVGWWQRLARGGPLRSWLFRLLWRMIVSSPRGFRWATSLCAAHRRAYLSSERTATTVDAMLPDLRNNDARVLCVLLDRLADIDIVPLLPQIQAPTLVIAGDKDPVVRLSHQRKIAAAIPHSELRILDNCGHMFFSERPGEFSIILEEWLQRL